MFSCYCGAAIGIWFIYGDFFIVLLQIAVPLSVHSAAGRDTRRAADDHATCRRHVPAREMHISYASQL